MVFRYYSILSTLGCEKSFHSFFFFFYARGPTTTMNNQSTSGNNSPNTPLKGETQLPVPIGSNLKYLFSSSKSASNYVPSALNMGINHAGLLNMDLIQSKIEYLEKERVDLTLQLHSRGEKDRERKIRMEQAEMKLKLYESENSRLNSQLQIAQSEVMALKLDKEELQQELDRKKKAAETGAHFEALDLWNRMTATTADLKKIEQELSHLKSTHAELLRERYELITKNEVLTKRLDVLESEAKDLENTKVELDESRLRVGFLQKIETCLDDELRETKSKLRTVTETLTAEIDRLTEENSAQSFEIANLSKALEDLSVEKKDKVSIAEEEYLAYQSSVASLQSIQKSLFESEQKRREIHNKLQEIRGNIRVFVRCRPFLPSDKAAVDLGEGIPTSNELVPCLSFYKDETLISLSNTAVSALSNTMRSVKSTAGSPSQPFSFDHIFTTEATQGDVYKEVSDLVQSALDGYRVCILSYGQSGSGKVSSFIKID